MTGTYADASIVFMNAIFLLENESKKRYPDPNFGPWLIEEIYDNKKLLALKKGVFNKKLFSPECNTELNLGFQSLKQIEFEFF
jgi:hypothetical protein